MILIDEDTQMDFLLPAGALYVPGSERLIPIVAGLFEEALRRGIPVISSVCAHAENDPEFADWPPHCVRGTLGQQKIAGTLCEGRTVVPNRPGADIPKGTGQVIVEKQTLDVFSNPNFWPLLERYPAEECAVVGVATDYCVRFAIEGLLHGGRKVAIVTDGVCGIDEEAARRVLSAAAARGARLTTSTALWA